ncbi:MAG: MepB family protein [Flavobacteriales bacterium]
MRFFDCSGNRRKNKGYFIFANSILTCNKILSTNNSEGKRDFRVYSLADMSTSKQATKTKNW